MNEIEQSIKTQKQIFYAYQPHLLQFLNSEEGKDFLKRKTGNKFPDWIIEIGRNHITEDTKQLFTKNQKILRGTFHPGQPYTDLFLPLIEKASTLQTKYMPVFNIADAMKYYAGYRTTKKYPRIYEEEIYKGFNPLMYQYLYNTPQYRWNTSTFNPAVGANSPVNGEVGSGNATDDVWANVYGAAGGQHSVDVTGEETARISTTSTSTHFGSMKRGIFLFDTSLLGAGAIISAATFSIYINSITQTLSQSLGITSCNPASNSNLADSDFAIANFGSTRFATDKTLASLSTGAYTDFALNAAGLTAISLTGITKLSTRMSSDIDNSAPSWSSSVSAIIAPDMAGGTNKPKLVVTYTPAPVVTTNNNYAFFM